MNQFLVVSEKEDRYIIEADSFEIREKDFIFWWDGGFRTVPNEEVLSVQRLTKAET